MTNKLKFKLLFALFSFFVGAIFVACNYDDSSREFHDEDGNKAHFKKEKVSFDVFSKNKKLFSKLITDEGILISKSANKIVSASDNSFFINTNSATYIENENGLHSYTFFINRNLENVLLENLVISLQEDGTYKSFIVTYNINQPELQNLKNGLFVDVDNRMNIEIFNDDNFMSQLSGKIVYSPCVTGTTEYWKCSNGNQHSPGNPGPPVCVADSFEYVINVEYGLCASDDGEVIGGGDTDGSNGGGGGSSDSNDSNDSTYDGSDTDIHGNGGVSTAPTLDEEEIEEETPCEILNNKTVNDSSYMANFNNLLESWRYTFPNESGFVVKKVNGLNTYSYLFANNKKSLTFPAGSLNYTHVHNNKPKENDAGEQYDAAVKILSPEDLKQLIGVCRRANMFYNLPETDSFGVMVSDEGIFCISIIDELSSAEIHTFLQNLGKFEKEYIRVGKKIATKYSELSENQRKEMLQKMFLKGLKKLGLENKIGLFEGEVTNVSGTDILNWTRKTLNDSEEIIPNPC